MTRSARIVNTVFLVFGILCLLYYLGMGFTVTFAQSMLFLWMIVGGVCIARYFLWKRAWHQGKRQPFPRWFLITERCIIAAGVAVFLSVEVIICTAAVTAPPPGLDAVVILGAKVNEDGPSGSLHERIVAAETYLRENPDTLALASGGQGDDEPMSEAVCIRDHLLAAGIEEARILTEERSTTTLENLQNSFAMLEGRAETVGILTNDFHIYRAMRIGRMLGGYELCGVPARSSVFGFVHYALREFCALTVMRLTGELT